MISSATQKKSASMLSQQVRLWVLLICGTLLYFFTNIQRVALPGSIFDLLQRDLSASVAGITAVGSVFMYVYALNQLFVGVLVDRFGGARVIVVGGLLLTAGSMFVPYCENLYALLCCRLLTGLGASTIYLGMVRELMRSFRSGFPMALASMIMIGYAGGILANAPFVFCVDHFGWRSVMAAIGLMTAVTYLIFLIMRASLVMPTIRKPSSSRQSFMSVLSLASNRRLFIFCGLNFGLFYVLQTVIGKKFLEDYFLMSSTDAALVLTLMGLLCALSGMAMVLLSRCCALRCTTVLRLAGLGSTISFLLVFLSIACDLRSAWMMLPLCVLASTSSSAAIAIPLLREINGSQSIGAAVSMFNAACFLVVAAFGNLVGLILSMHEPSDIAGRAVYAADAYFAVFAMLLCCSAFALWQVCCMREPASAVMDQAD